MSNSSPKVRRVKQIVISPFEAADTSQLQDTLKSASEIFGIQPTFYNEVFFTSPISEVEKERGQRDAESIVLSAKEATERLAKSDHSLASNLLVTDQDIFVRGMHFVFGLAIKELGVAVVSTFRLTRWTDDLTSIRIEERILKEAAHEIGHLFGLSHCPAKKCLMAFSNSLQEVDTKLPMICNECQRKLVGVRIS